MKKISPNLLGRYADSVVASLMLMGAKSATEFIEPNLIARASRRTFKGRMMRGNLEIVLTIGRPNSKEKEFVKSCKKANDKFPLTKLKYLPEKRK